MREQLRYCRPYVSSWWLCWFVWQRRRLPYTREVLSVILAFIGVVLIATHGRITELCFCRPRALIWGSFLDAVSCVVYTLLSIKPVRKWGSVVVNAIGMLTGGIFLSFLYRPWEVMPHLDLAGWLAFFGIVLFGTVLTYVLFLQGVRDIGPLNTTLIATVEPMSSALLFGPSFGNGSLPLPKS